MTSMNHETLLGVGTAPVICGCLSDASGLSAAFLPSVGSNRVGTDALFFFGTDRAEALCAFAANADTMQTRGRAGKEQYSKVLRMKWSGNLKTRYANAVHEEGDVYSLGHIVWQLLSQSGELPFSGLHIHEVTLPSGFACCAKF